MLLPLSSQVDPALAEGGVSQERSAPILFRAGVPASHGRNILDGIY